jgi:putative DNA primase/helicase
LSWAIEGLIEYKKISLSPPQEVLAAVKEYRQEMNTEALFVDKCCVIEADNGEKIANKTLYESYCEFCTGHGLSPDSIRDLTKEIRKLKGVGEHSLSRAIHWSGIRLNDENQIVATTLDANKYQEAW